MNKFIPKNEHYKCAPSKQYDEGTCFTLEALQTLAREYNKHVGKNNNSIITVTNSKQDLLRQLSKNITNCKSNQLCWIKQEWFNNNNNKDIINNTFRPKGPQEKFKWFSTTNINDIISQYEDKYTDFKFLGAVPMDFEKIPELNLSHLDLDKLYKKKKTKLGMVINLDEHWQSGSHWVALYADILNNQIYYFDSYGMRPEKRVCNFVKKIALWCYNRNIKNNKNKINYDTESQFMKKYKNKYENLMDIRYNQTRHQYKNSECGVYSVNFILRLLKGDTFDKISNIPVADDNINECRKVYFTF